MEAIHPGYGFLAENAHFNEVCRSCNIDFIGPSTRKRWTCWATRTSARELAKAADVPVVPGSDGLVQEESDALRVAHEIGFPVLIKASAGGGGKGYARRLETAWRTSRRH